MNENSIYGFISAEEQKQVLAQLRTAAWMGLIPSSGLDEVENRRKEKNEKIEEWLAAAETVYGPTHYTPAMYLQYELTCCKLDYTFYADVFLDDYQKNLSRARYACGLDVNLQKDNRGAGRLRPAKSLYREFTEEEKQAFYQENRDLFTRYSGDSFSYEEVSMIIEKRLREQEYEGLVRDVYSLQERMSLEPAAEERRRIQNEQVMGNDGQTDETSMGNTGQTGETSMGNEGQTYETFIGNHSQSDCNTGQARRIYYVSSENGSDENDGSQEHPFATLFAVNRLRLNPGDQVLLKRGSVFRGQFLHLSAWGAKDAPILIGAYGDGLPPKVEAMGQGIWYQDYGTELDSPTHTREGYVSSAVLLYDCAYLTLRDIAVTNYGSITGEIYEAPRKMNRTGVAAVAKNRGTLREIHLENLEIRDVNGNVYDKHMNNGGIYFTCLKPDNEEATGAARYEGVSITGCFVHRVSRWGIAVGYTYQWRNFIKAELEDELFEKYGHRDIRIADNFVKEAGGDGITVMYALRPLVEHNSAHSCAGEMNDRVYKYPEGRGGKVAAGIWPWKCKDALFQYNKAMDTRLNQDGMAWDADSGDGTTYQYNYSRLNEGGCVMFCLEEAVHNTFRYNFSHDDLGGTISPSGNPDAYIHHNTFIKREDVPFVRAHMDGGKFVDEENDIREI